MKTQTITIVLQGKNDDDLEAQMQEAAKRLYSISTGAAERKDAYETSDEFGSFEITGIEP